MPNLTETAVYEADIYQLDPNDPVMGGEDGVDNVPLRQLANRTAFLKESVDAAHSDIASTSAALTASVSAAIVTSEGYSDNGIAADRLGRDAGVQRAGEVAVTDPRYPIADPRRYGADVTGGADARPALVLANTYAGRVVVRGGVLLVSANLTITNLRVYAGAKLKPAAGVTITMAGKLRAECQQIFDLSLGGKVLFAPGVAAALLPEWWGAIGDRVTDDATPLQQMWDCAMQSNDIGAVYKLWISRQYASSTSIRGFRWAAGVFQYVTYSVDGPARSYITGQGAEIVLTAIDRPALILQGVRTTGITHVKFVGAAGAVFPTYANLRDDTGGAGGTPWYNPAGARDSRCSPHCAIAIDPFSNALPADGGIPGHATYYTDSSKGSSIVDIEKVKASGFIVGAAVSLSPSTQLGDSIRISECNFELCKVPVAVGQSQNRAVTIENAHVLGCRTFVDCVNYGAGNAPLPTIRGGNIGYVKWIINALANWSSSGKIKDLYAESTLSLGFWNNAGYALTWEDCYVAWAWMNGGLEPDSRGQFGAPVVFKGGAYVAGQGTADRFSIWNNAKVHFDGVALDGEPQFAFPNAVTFRGCSLNFTSGSGLCGISDKFIGDAVNLLSISHATLSPGGEVVDNGSGPLSYTKWRSREGYKRVSLATVPLTVNADGTGSFTDASAIKCRVGDWVSTSTSWFGLKYAPTQGNVDHANLFIGRVTSVVGNLVSLNRMPQSLTGGNYALFIERLPQFRIPAVGTTVAASNQLSNVSPTTGWAVNDRIESANFPSGTYITAIAGTTFTLSQNATVTGTAELYDVKMWVESAVFSAAPTTRSWFRGDYVTNPSPSKDANNMLLVGWRCTGSGRADGVTPAATFEPQYVSAVTPAT